MAFIDNSKSHMSRWIMIRRRTSYVVNLMPRDQEPSALDMFVVALQGFFVLAVDAADGADGGHANMATHLFSALDGTSYAPLKRLLRPHLMTGEVC